MILHGAITLGVILMNEAYTTKGVDKSVRQRKFKPFVVAISMEISIPSTSLLLLKELQQLSQVCRFSENYTSCNRIAPTSRPHEARASTTPFQFRA